MKIQRLAIAAMAGALMCGSAYAQPAAPKGPGGGRSDQATTITTTLPTLSAKGAQDMINAVEKLARDHHQGVTVAIVDAGGNLLAFKRMDGADLGTIDAAMTKVHSALKLRTPTGVFEGMAGANPGMALGFMSAGFTILGGGQPIRINGVVVGAIGCSGGAGGEDDLYNNAGLAAVGATLAPIAPPAPAGK